MVMEETPPPAPRQMVVYSHSWLPGQVDGVAVRMMGHVKDLARRGTNVVLITPDFVPYGESKAVPPYDGLSDVKQHVTVESAWMPVYRKNLSMRMSLSNFLKIFRVLRSTKPEVVHATQESSLAVMTLACILCNVPLVISFHTDVGQIAQRDPIFSSFGGLMGRLQKNFLIFCNSLGLFIWNLSNPVWLAVSDQAKDNIRAGLVSDSKIYPECWGPAVDRDTFRIDLPADEVAASRRRLTFGIPNVYLMVYVGRVTEEKDIQFLVDALDRAPKHVVLAIIGPGSMTEELKKLHGPERRLYCTGQSLGREEVALALRAADCGVSASTMETVGFNALEAMSCGTPFLAARAQGFALHLDHGVNARLWTPHDPASFDEELAALMATKKEGCWSREAIRATMEKASVARCTDRALGAYRHAIARPANFRPIRIGLSFAFLSINWALSFIVK